MKSKNSDLLLEEFQDVDKTIIPVTFLSMKKQDIFPEHRATQSIYYRTKYYYTLNFHKPISRCVNYQKRSSNE